MQTAPSAPLARQFSDLSELHVNRATGIPHEPRALEEGCPAVQLRVELDPR